MIRGTTPTNYFKTDIDLSDVAALYVTYQQNNRTVIEKTLDDVHIDPDKITVQLSQEDTLALDAKAKVYIQIRAAWDNGTAIASNIEKTDVSKVLKEGVI